MNTHPRSTGGLLLALGLSLSTTMPTVSAINMTGENEIGESTTARIKQMLKDPFLTLLATSEFTTKENLQRRIKDVEESLNRFKTELSEGKTPSVTPVTTPAMATPAPAPEVQPVTSAPTMPAPAPEMQTPAMPAPEVQPAPPAPMTTPTPAPEIQPPAPMPTPTPEVQPPAPAPMTAPMPVPEMQPPAPTPTPEVQPTPPAPMPMTEQTPPPSGAMATTPVQPTGSMVPPPTPPVTPAESMAVGVPPVGTPGGMPVA